MGVASIILPSWQKYFTQLSNRTV